MEFTHVANPVRVSAKRIANIDHRLDGTGLIDIMFDDESQTILTDEMVARYVPVLGDYFVIQEDGYGYVNPKDVFERKYSGIEQQTGVDFGSAIRALKSGKRVARAGWNGKGMWLSLSGPNGPREIAFENFWSHHNSEYARMNGGSAKVLPCITMKTATGEILMGWLASQTDMLADDWQIV